jgi:hypothetical protein
MSSLKAVLEQRRAEEKDARSHSSKDGVPMLFVATSGGENWLLPWNHFVFGCHKEEGERERLVLTFVAHKVDMSGVNLGDLIPEVVHQRLERLRAAPGKYITSSGNEPFIEQIEVRSLAEHTVTE